MGELHSGGITAHLTELTTAAHRYMALVAASALSAVSDADILAELTGLESLRRRLAVIDHALIGELDRRGIAGRLVMSSTAAVLQGLLRLSRSAEHTSELQSR